MYLQILVMADLLQKACNRTESEGGLEDKEEFDDAADLAKSYCIQISEDEFEEQGVSETEKALEVHVKNALKGRKFEVFHYSLIVIWVRERPLDFY